MATQNAVGDTLYVQYNNETETFPVSTSLTGTISTVNGLNKEIVGVGTLFTTELQEGDWLYVASAGEVRQIENIVSDTKLSVKQAFSTLAGATPKKVFCSFRKISVSIEGTTATVNGMRYYRGTITEIGDLTDRSRKATITPLIMFTGATDYIVVTAQ